MAVPILLYLRVHKIYLLAHLPISNHNTLIIDNMHYNRIAAPRLYASMATNLSNIALLISRTTDKQHLLKDLRIVKIEIDIESKA